MRRIYVVIGELEDTAQVDTIECAYATMQAAEDRCFELEAHPDNRHIWCWRETVLREEGD